jgi:hypothetical protein
MSEDSILESRPHALDEVESPQTVPAVGRAPNAKSLNQEVEAPAPVRREDPGEWIEWPAQPEEEQPQATSKIPDQPPQAPPFGLRHRSDASRRDPGRRLRLSGLR